jgi:hypothetical protein
MQRQEIEERAIPPANQYKCNNRVGPDKDNNKDNKYKEQDNSNTNLNKCNSNKQK